MEARRNKNQQIDSQVAGSVTTNSNEKGLNIPSSTKS
jgi:hypothetical protein